MGNRGYLVLAFLVFAVNSLFAQISIQSLSSSSAVPGEVITINGTGFNGSVSSNVVFFGGVKATVSSASSSSLSVVVPTGAAYGPITVLNSSTQLQTTSSTYFTPVFTPSKGSTWTVNDFDPLVAPASTSGLFLEYCDVDGDGKIDIVESQTNTGGFRVKRNVSVPGTLTTASFVNGTLISTGQTYLESITCADMNNDGKLDIVVAGSGGGTGSTLTGTLSIYVNNSTPGTISFATPIQKSYNMRVNSTCGGRAGAIKCCDLDKNGWLDVVLANSNYGYGANSNSNCNLTLLGTVFANSNGVLGSQQDIFVASYTARSSRITQLEIADMNNDGKLDLIFGVRSRTYILKNISSPNSLTASSFVLVNTTILDGDRMLLVGDLDLDGDLDLGVAGRLSSTTLRLYRNTTANQAFGFDAGLNLTIGGIHSTVNNLGGAVGDITGDGRPELLIGGSTPRIMLNKITSATANWSTASFSALTNISLSSNVNALAIVDLDHDGRNDIIGRSGSSGNALAMRRSNPIPTINVGDLALQYCPGTQLDVPFFTTYSVSAGNTYTVQLSNATGSFTTPTIIGTLTSNATSGTISCVLPNNIAAGTAYKIRINASTPNVTGIQNTGNIIINSNILPTVSIVSSQSLVCLSSQVTYTATEENGGTSPVYTWRKNGQIVGSNSPVYQNANPLSGDVVFVQIQGNAQCNVNTATSNSITLTGVAVVTPSVSITNTQSTICDFSTSVTYSANAVNGGVNPVFVWMKNGVVVGTNSSQWTDNDPLQGDQVEVQMTSTATCVTSPVVLSNILTLQYSGATVVPSAIISTTQTNLCVGVNQVVFNANIVNGGSSPTYQLKRNGVNVGNNSSQYVLSNPANNDQIQLVLTSNADCATPTAVSSNTITLTTQSVNSPSIVISTPLTTLCGNANGIQYTAVATNGGSNPLISWYKNGQLVGQGVNVYSNPTPQNGDVVQATLLSNGSCLNSTNATSNSITIVVNSIVNPTINLVQTQGTNPKCAGGFQQLTAQVSNAGNNPSYAWYRNGVVVNGATTAVYGSSTWALDDIIYCQVVPTNTCQSTNLLVTTEFVVNENTPVDFYADADGDGFGDLNNIVSGCGAPVGYVDNALDCDDNASNIYPGNNETCDQLDNDCNGEIDEFVTTTFYADVDGDGFGDLTNSTEACSVPFGFVSDATDCDDLELTYEDNDGDGFGGLTAAACGSYTNDDCNDNNANISPLGVDVCGNSIDEDCSGSDDVCAVLGCTVANACNYDPSATIEDGSCILPQPEVCNDLDDDCDGTVDDGLAGIGSVTSTTVSTALYPTCSTANIASANLNLGANTAQINGTGPDLWYKLTAGYNTLRAGLSASIGDNTLYLFQDLGTCLQQMDMVQLANTGGNQTLFSDELVIGENYYIVLHGEGGVYNASAKMCFNHFVASTCDHTYSNNTGVYSSSCSSFKAQYKANATSYVFNVLGGSQNGTNLNLTPWSYTTTSSSSVVSRIGRIFPANQTATPIEYQVNVPAVYSVPDVLGNLHVLTATGGSACSVTMSPETTIALRAADRCPALKPLSSFISIDRTICAAEKYEWEFSQVLPVAQAAIRVMGGVNSSILLLTNVPGIANGRTYNVRVRPVYFNGTKGEWGTAQCLSTATSGMIVQNDNSNPIMETVVTPTFELYPNPTSGEQVQLIWKDGSVEHDEVTVWDLQGKRVMSLSFNQSESNTLTLPTVGLADGVYFVRCGQTLQRLVMSR
ncbi:MAG: hypothetical protein RL362_342 [Bacteroidota bacterium]